MLGVCAGAANTVTGIIYAGQGKEPCLVSSCLFGAGLFKSPVTEKHRPQFYLSSGVTTSEGRQIKSYDFFNFSELLKLIIN